VNEEWDIMTDEEYFKFTKNWIKESHRVLKENGSIFISTTYHNL
jgi:DNA modification methylase